MILITNISRRPVLIVAHHEQVCCRSGVCSCTAGRPAAYRIAAGKQLRCPAAVLHSLDARVALRLGAIRVVPVPVATNVPPTAAPPPGGPDAGNHRDGAMPHRSRRNK